MSTNDSKINQLFNNLDTWRHLPNYQLERRADIFFSLYLAEVLHEQKFLELVGELSIIPEFPCRIGTVDCQSESNRSFKIDYLVTSETSRKACFVELKTDNGSVAHTQIVNMQKACAKSLGSLTSAISNQIMDNTNAGSKYSYLIEKTKKYEEWKNVHPKIVFIVPIAPPISSPLNQVSKDQITILTFEDFIKAAEKHNTCAISQSFANSLRKWQTKAGSPNSHYAAKPITV